ncbi:MAG: GNAT family N-acetyltransferase [Candidatus Bathyarchaeia archaeon]|jgi:GNAT superfamily N-acetyltransferase
MKFNIQYATLKDTELLAKHRLNMWCDILPEPVLPVTGTEERTLEWIREKLSSGRLIGFITKTEERQVAGSGCIWIREQPPLPMSQFLEVPYLMSLYTEREFRRRGVARLIVETAIAWCRAHGYDRVNLDASEAGKSLYETFGFKPGYGMRLQL